MRLVGSIIGNGTCHTRKTRATKKGDYDGVYGDSQHRAKLCW
jgi:hypothetical protein